jgi:phage-related minor tail protein
VRLSNRLLLPQPLRKKASSAGSKACSEATAHLPPLRQTKTQQLINLVSAQRDAAAVAVAMTVAETVAAAKAATNAAKAVVNALNALTSPITAVVIVLNAQRVAPLAAAGEIGRNVPDRNRALTRLLSLMSTWSQQTT